MSHQSPWLYQINKQTFFVFEGEVELCLKKERLITLLFRYFNVKAAPTGMFHQNKQFAVELRIHDDHVEFQDGWESAFSITDLTVDTDEWEALLKKWMQRPLLHGHIKMSELRKEDKKTLLAKNTLIRPTQKLQKKINKLRLPALFE